jgi:uncharacterized iron-regulated membrane protein
MVENAIRRVALVAVVTGLLVAAAGCRVAGSVGGNTDSAALPADAVPADVVASVAPPAEGMISRDEAISAAAKQYSTLLRDGNVAAYLVVATDPSTRGPVEITDRALWVLHVSGVAYPISVPYGRSTESDSVSNGWIYIDAYTGKWLLSRFED